MAFYHVHYSTSNDHLFNFSCISPSPPLQIPLSPSPPSHPPHLTSNHLPRFFNNDAYFFNKLPWRAGPRTSPCNTKSQFGKSISRHPNKNDRCNTPSLHSQKLDLHEIRKPDDPRFNRILA